MSDLGQTSSMINLKEGDDKSIKSDQKDFSEDIISAFGIFDLEKTGLIPKQKLKYVLTALGQGMDNDDADSLIRSLHGDIIYKDKTEYIDYLKLFSDTNAEF
mmetsp:Transcript_11081/g.9810  ORF Transcript_11081/g.9810 Transcript_11081/m.9810 type:complete len:102 (+) Transcript_11081:191-496(+)